MRHGGFHATPSFRQAMLTPEGCRNMVTDRHNRQVVTIRVLRDVAMAAAGAVVTLAQLNLPSKHLWDPV
jgi:hypothetical protein